MSTCGQVWWRSDRQVLADVDASRASYLFATHADGFDVAPATSVHAEPSVLFCGVRCVTCAPIVGPRAAQSRYDGHMSRLERITSDPTVCHGQPTVRGLRYTVEALLELLSAGMTIDEVLADYPDLEQDDLLAALEFGALAVGRRRVVPLDAA